MTSCILLSAGLSERFGSPKALARFSGATVIEHVQKTLLQSTIDEIIVVLGAHAELIQPSIFIHKRIRVVYNKDYFFGQTSSVKAGCQEIDHLSSGILFLPVDCPLVTASSISLIIEHFKANPTEILIPTYKNKKGHPPIFNQHLRTKILELPNELGINSLFSAYPPQTFEINDQGIVESFNTPEEFEKIKLIARQ